MEPRGADEHQSSRHSQNRTTEDHTTEAESKNGNEGMDEDRQCELEAQNLGWNHEAEHAEPLADGMTNAEIWTLVRRFNKQIFRVRTINRSPLTGLDMNDTSGENVSSERVRVHVERLYMTVIVSLYSFHKHIVRLRSWKEKPRTLIFLAVYVVSWLADAVALALTCFCIVLIVHPPSRDACFPPVAPSLIDPKTGGVQSPLAGELASDSVTGAPERQPGEAVEQEAHNFMMSIGKLIMSVSSGSHAQNDSHDSDILPQPSSIAEGIANLQNKAEGRESNDGNDKTKEPVSHAVDNFEIHPAIRMLPDFIDNWERFGNALSPAPPFPPQRQRLILATCLLPLVFIFGYATWDHIVKGLGFVVGFVFFGGPVIVPVVCFLDALRPGWRQSLELRNTVLRGSPTNAQLAVTILRIGERDHRPLPPPPNVRQSPSTLRRAEGQHLSTLGGSEKEIEAAMKPDSDQEEPGSEADHGHTKSKKTRVTNGIKRMAKGSIQPLIKVSRAAAPAGGKHATGWLGALDAPLINAEAGPVRFPARFEEENGHLYITTTATTPSISWRRVTDDIKSAWTVPMDDIVELSKVGGMGWKRKYIVSKITESEVADGLLLKTKGGRRFYLTTITMRDEVFNRLVSIGRHTWEIW